MTCKYVLIIFLSHSLPLLQRSALSVAIGHLKMKHEEIEENVIIAVDFLITLLKDKWENIRSIIIKSTYGRPHRIF